MDHLSFASLLVPVLLVARVILDLITIGTGYRLEVASFLVFLVAGVAILEGNPNDLWGFLALAIALFSLGQFLFRRFRHSRTKPPE